MPAGIQPSAAERLNRSCFCITLDRDGLHAAMVREAGDPGFAASHILPREHLFADAPVFLEARDVEHMSAVVDAIETAARLPGYREAVLGWAPDIARLDPGPHGVFMGYDFHLGPAGPKLIEINTNAGGAFLNVLLAKAQRACCPELERAFKLPLIADFDIELIGMFQEEWASQRTGQSLQRIAIVDDDPEQQYLYPEFLLAREAFRRHGIDAVIADARTLRFEQGRLWAGAVPVDLVYNRLVDFALQGPEHAALRAAYLAGAAVVTPNPRNHALLADKRNLTVLSDSDALIRLGLDSHRLAHLVGRIPRTLRVTQDNADGLWSARKQLFFKPAAGHGAKAVYRGDKLTRGVWQHIVAGDYVAQTYAPPGERTIKRSGGRERCKSDIRLFTYRGRALLAAARLYQGQTTNFRTPGGGFAPVFFFGQCGALPARA